MANYQDLLDAVARIRSATGGDDAWMTGLSADDISIVANPASSPAAVEAVLTKLTAAHPAIFGSGAGNVVQPIVSDHSEGAAAEAIRTAETALAQQNSQTAQLDLEVITAVLNAHAKHTEGVAALEQLQSDIEAAVASRTDLDTPAGARSFQRYLIDKLREIRAVVETADLDATSKAALAAALASLYASSATTSGQAAEVSDQPRPAPEPQGSSATGPASVFSPGAEHRSPYSPDPAAPTDLGLDPLPPLSAETAYPPMDSAPGASATTPAATMPPVSAGWGGGAPATGMPLGASLPTLPSASIPDFSTDPNSAAPHHGANHQQDSMGPEPNDPKSEDPAGRPSTGNDPSSDDPTAVDPTAVDPTAVDPTSVELPDGQIVIAPNPRLAAVITAAVAGNPISDAFSAQAITIPAPGSAITEPVEPDRLVPGDIGLFTDRHALALGGGKALLNNQIQTVASMPVLGFIGWQHPPEPIVTTPPVVPAPDPPPQTANG